MREFSEAVEPIDYLFALAQKAETPCLPYVWSFLGEFLSYGRIWRTKNLPHPQLSVSGPAPQPQNCDLDQFLGSNLGTGAVVGQAVVADQRLLLHVGQLLEDLERGLVPFRHIA